MRTASVAHTGLGGRVRGQQPGVGGAGLGGVASAPGMILSWTQTSSLAAVERIEWH